MLVNRFWGLMYNVYPDTYTHTHVCTKINIWMIAKKECIRHVIMNRKKYDYKKSIDHRNKKNELAKKKPTVKK